MEQKNKKEIKVLIGAKVPERIKKAVEEKAEREERTVSQTISRLLASHPELNPEKQLAISS